MEQRGTEWRVAHRRSSWRPGVYSRRVFGREYDAKQWIKKLTSTARPDLEPIEDIIVSTRPVGAWSEPLPRGQTS